MARKVQRCLRKNYKKKVKASIKSEKATSESANEIASLFKGVGDYEAAKRSVAIAQKSAAAATTSNKKNGGAVASSSNNSKKVPTKLGGKKKKLLADSRKKKITKKTLHDEDNVSESEEDDDDENDDEDDEVEDDEAEEDGNDDNELELPDVNLLTTEEQLVKYRTLLRKRQVKEKMALREHIRELEKKKASMRGSKHVAEELRREKRDLGKYIRQLEEEQKSKHAAAMKDIEIRIAQKENARRDPFLVAAEKAKAKNRLKYLGASASSGGIYQAGLGSAFVPNLGAAAPSSFGGGGGFGDNDMVDAKELQNMFAHLM